MRTRLGRREKVFGPGRAVPLDRNAKARIMAYARAWGARHRQPGRCCEVPRPEAVPRGAMTETCKGCGSNSPPNTRCTRSTSRAAPTARSAPHARNQRKVCRSPIGSTKCGSGKTPIDRHGRIGQHAPHDRQGGEGRFQ
jgi:hypothetical protein